VDARPDLGGSIVKSAQRVIQLLELFDDVRTGLTVADVASKLKMPQSSTSALLQSLHTLGYLAINPEQRTYFPSIRVALLGHWIEPLLVREGPIVQMARRVSAKVGLDSFVAIRNKLHVQIVYRHYDPDLKAPHSLTGSGSFMVLAATGHVLMSDMSERDTTKLVAATNALLPAEAPRVSPRELLAKLERVRRDGFAAGQSQRAHDQLTVAVRLPSATVEPMAFGVSVPAHQIGDDPRPWADLLKSAAHEFLAET
jgi:DNA-binding IclR family transcriptional regulator